MKRSLLVGTTLLAGCGYLGSARGFSPKGLEDPGWIAVRDVPLILQRDEADCGAAAVAMILHFWKDPIRPDDVISRYPPGDGGGIRAGDLRSFLRSRGLSAFLFRGRMADFKHELSRDRPVVVGTVKRFLDGYRKHYEVVVALHPERRLIVTVDPARGWRVNDYDGFIREWDRAGRLTLVAFPISRPEKGGIRP